MALAYHQRLTNKVRSLLASVLTSYDPFGDKLLEHFRVNPHHPFTQTQPFTFEYRYRRWSTIYFIVVLQILLVLLTLYTYYRLHPDDYWTTGSQFLLLFLFSLVTIFLGSSLTQNLKERHIILSLLDLRVSIYVNNVLTDQCSIDRAYICLRGIESYNILLYHLVFIVEDMDSIKISDYFPHKLPLRQIGKRLAQNLFLSYIESDSWTGIFPKYKRLKSYVHRPSNNENHPFPRRRKSQSHTKINL